MIRRCYYRYHLSATPYIPPCFQVRKAPPPPLPSPVVPFAPHFGAVDGLEARTKAVKPSVTYVYQHQGVTSSRNEC